MECGAVLIEPFLKAANDARWERTFLQTRRTLVTLAQRVRKYSYYHCSYCYLVISIVVVRFPIFAQERTPLPDRHIVCAQPTVFGFPEAVFPVLQVVLTSSSPFYTILHDPNFEGSLSAMGSTQCTCSIGSYWSSVSCLACPAGAMPILTSSMSLMTPTNIHFQENFLELGRHSATRGLRPARTAWCLLLCPQYLRCPRQGRQLS